jgi:hypothetical protein
MGDPKPLNTRTWQVSERLLLQNDCGNGPGEGTPLKICCRILETAVTN